MSVAPLPILSLRRAAPTPDAPAADVGAVLPLARGRAREILPLTGIRFPVTLAVLLLHFLPADAARPAGDARMPLFFVISGFVMMAAYYPTPDRKLGLVPFYLRRLARLYPLLVLTTLAVSFWFFRDQVLPWWHQSRVSADFFGTVLLSLGIVLFPPAYLLGLTAPTPNLPAWFVMVELSAGLLIPLAARVLWRLSPRQVVALAVVLPAAAQAYANLIAPRLPSVEFTQMLRMELSRVPLNWLLVILFGAAVYRVYDLVVRSPVLSARVGRAATPLTLLTLYLVYFDLPLATHPVGRVLVYSLGGWTLLALALSGGWAARALSAGPLLYLSRRSYSIYMMSAPLALYLIPRTIGSRGYGWVDEHGLWGGLGCIVATCLAGVLVYRLVELPGQRWFRRATERWAKPGAKARAVTATVAVPAARPDAETDTPGGDLRLAETGLMRSAVQ